MSPELPDDDIDVRIVEKEPMAAPPNDVSDGLVIRESSRLAPRRSASKPKSSDMMVVCAMVIILALVVGIYAIKTSVNDEPSTAPTTTPAVAPVVQAPEPRPAPVAKRSRPASQPKAESPPRQPAQVVVHVEKEEPAKKVVDPIEGFDSGEAFDNPASPGRYGQRSSGLYPSAGSGSDPVMNRRPNSQDPSNRNPPR